MAFLGLAFLAVSLNASPASAARPGTHAYYAFDQPGMPTSFYNFDIYATWMAAPSSAGIYPAFQFWFEQGAPGYLGTQLVGTTKKATFSIWDVADHAHTALPIAWTCKRFGDDVDVEGTGAQCIIDYAWIAGHEYRLRIWVLGVVSGGQQWLATIQDTTTGLETQIGIIQLQNQPGHDGYGYLTSGASFLEYFSGPDSCNGQAHSQVRWRGPYGNNGTVSASRATVGLYGCSTHNDVTTTGEPVLFHEIGDTVSLTNPEGTTLWPGGCGVIGGTNSAAALIQTVPLWSLLALSRRRYRGSPRA